MSEYSERSPFVEALLTGNRQLMKIRLAEEYSSVFERYQELLEKRRRFIMSEENNGRTAEDSELILRVIDEQIRVYATELSIQDRIEQSAEVYFDKFFGVGDES